MVDWQSQPWMDREPERFFQLELSVFVAHWTDCFLQVSSSSSSSSTGRRSLLPSWSLDACAHLHETWTPRPRSSLTTYVFATKSFRVRSVLLVSRARIGAGVITHATIPLTSSCCSLASGRALPPKFLVGSCRHCILPWCLMVSRHPRHVSRVLTDWSANLVEPSLRRFGFSSCLRLSRA